MRQLSSVAAVVALLGVLTISAPPAYAVHLDELFELENLTDGGDAIDDLSSPEDDWGTTSPAICGALASCGYVAGPSAPGGNSLTSRFLNDVSPAGSTDDVFTGGGSKDDLDISQWQWTRKFGVTDKDDIQQGGAAAYNLEGETLIYFFNTLLAPNGDAATGLWLFQDRIKPMGGRFMQVDSLDNPIGVASHKVGDIFVSSKLSNGGRRVAIVVYKWVGPGNAADCPGGAAALAPPKDSLCVIREFEDARCGAAPDIDEGCGTMNLVSSESPDDWGYTSKFPPDPSDPAWPLGTDGIDMDDFPATTYFEGGVNLTQLGLTGCFSTFLLETRASDRVRATLKDFTTGDFPLCGLDVQKACTPSTELAPNPVIDADGDSIVTTFDILIANTGVSTIYDVSVEEDKGFDPDESCWIDAVDGDTTGHPTPLPTDTPVIVADSLTAAEDPIEVTIKCDTFDNPFLNEVTVRAKTSELLIDPDLEDSDQIVDTDPPTPIPAGGACPAQAEGAMLLDKNCQEDPTTLVLDAGQLRIQVNVDFYVKNERDEKLLGVVLSDDKIGIIDVGDLAPGEEWLSGPMSYIADMPDGVGPWDPRDAEFTDRVEVIDALGAISDEQIRPVPNFATATCPLCDCPTCP